MAFTFAGHWLDSLTNSVGVPLPATAVSVFLRGTTTLATLYTSRTKATTVANPTVTDARGNLSLYADPGEYDLLCLGVTLPITMPIDTIEAAQDSDLANYVPTTAVGTTVATVASVSAVAAAPGKAPDWTANTVYAKDALVVQGTTLYRALAAFTSGATFNAANWAVVVNTATNVPLRAFNVVNFGAVGDGVTNDHAAFLAAGEACRAVGRGIVYIPKPPSFYLVNSTTSFSLDMYGMKEVEIVGEQSAVRITGNTGRGGFNVLNARRATVRGIVFQGTAARGLTPDVYRHINGLGCDELIVEDCTFDGCLAEQGTIYASGRVDLRDLHILGCGAPASTGVIFIQNPMSVRMQHILVFDFGDISGTPRAVAATIRIDRADAVINAFTNSLIEMSGIILDEGANPALLISGGTNKFQDVRLRGVYVNGNGADSIVIDQVKHLVVEDSEVNYNSGPVSSAINVSNATKVRLENVRAKANSNKITLASTVAYAEVIDCEYTTLANSAATSRVFTLGSGYGDATLTTVQTFSAAKTFSADAIFNDGGAVYVGQSGVPTWFEAALNLQTRGTGQFGQVIRGRTGQTQNLFEAQQLGTAQGSGFKNIGHIFTRNTSAPASADLIAGELVFWFDATTGAAKAMFKGKNAAGTVVTGSVSLI